jgi:hypothetical protein
MVNGSANAPAADKVNDLQPIAITHRCFGPAGAGHNLMIQLNRDPISFHTNRSDQCL